MSTTSSGSPCGSCWRFCGAPDAVSPEKFVFLLAFNENNDKIGSAAIRPLLNKIRTAMRSITTFDIQYAHRFYRFQGEAQYLHGHTGVLTIEVEDSVEPGVNMVFPCNEIQKTAWDVIKNFDHALILREDDPLLPAILDVYEKQGIKNGHRTNTMKGEAFSNELCTAYPDCRLVVTKETMTVEGMIKIVYSLLKDKLNIAKITFTSGVNAASCEFEVKGSIDRCPLCGIALDKDGSCPKCGYKKK